MEARALNESEPGADALALIIGAAMQRSLPFWSERDELELPPPPRRCASVDGYSIHANVRIGAKDREGLERLLRYCARPAVALRRMSRLPDGRIGYQLKRRLATGESMLRLEEMDLMRRLAALIPPPRANLTRFHGAFAPASRLRPLVVAATHARVLDGPASEKPAGGRLKWAELIKRVFGTDVLECGNCGGTMEVMAAITERAAIKRILRHLGLPSELPPLTRAQVQEWLPFGGETREPATSQESSDEDLGPAPRWVDHVSQEQEIAVERLPAWMRGPGRPEPNSAE
jgi:hypothetical protein